MRAKLCGDPAKPERNSLLNRACIKDALAAEQEKGDELKINLKRRVMKYELEAALNAALMDEGSGG